MNRNYKVIWNQSLNCFMAVAEYAKSRGKSSSTVSSTSTASAAISSGARLVRLSSLTVALAATGMTLSTQVFAFSGDGGTAAGSGAIAIGSDSSTARTGNQGNQSVAIGVDAKVQGDQSVGLGANVRATGNSSIAIGGDDLNSVAGTSNNTAAAETYKNLTGDDLIRAYDRQVGPENQYYGTTTGNGAVAIGVQASALGDLSTSFGTRTQANGVASTALGVGATSSKDGSVALGAGSRTDGNATKVESATVNGVTFVGFQGSFAGKAGDEGRQVSVGNKGNERQIKNVAPGELSASSTDAINGSQIYAVSNKLIDNIRAVTNTAPVVYTTADGTQLYKVGTQFFDNTDGTGTAVSSVDIITSVRNANGSTTKPTKLTNVTAGTIAASSTDAVNGGQINTIAQGNKTLLGGGATVDTNGVVTSTDIGGTGSNTIDGAISAANTQANKALTFTGNVLNDTDANGSQQKLGSTLNISGGATAASSNANVKTVITDGKVDIQIANAPTFTGQVKANGFDANSQKITNVLAGTANTDAANVGQVQDATNAVTNTAPVVYTTAGGTQLYKVGTQFFDNTDGTGTAVSSADIITSVRNANGSTTTATKLSNIANGTIAKDSTDAVNGSQLNTTNTNVAKNSTAIGDINAGRSGIVRQDAGTGAITVGAQTKGTSVNFAGADGVRTLSGLANGDISKGSTQAVTGDQLNTTNNDISSLQGKTFSLQANNDTASAVGQNDTVRFLDGENIDITRNGNNITVATASDVNFDNVTVGNSKLGNSGLRVTDPLANSEANYTADGFSVSNQQTNTVSLLQAGNFVTFRVDENTGMPTNGSAVTSDFVYVGNGQGNGSIVTNDGFGFSDELSSMTPNLSSTSPSIRRTGIDAGSTRITKVADGIELTDAANLGQVQDAANAITNTAPVVYTKADGTQVYKVGTQFFDNAAGTGTAVTPADIITSVRNANGSTTTATKLSNIANGTIATDSTDAVNGSQLNTTNAAVTDNNNRSTGNLAALGGGAKYDAATDTYTAPSYRLNNGDNNTDTTVYRNVGDALGNLDTRTTTNTSNIANLNNKVNGIDFPIRSSNAKPFTTTATGIDTLAVGSNATARGIRLTAVGEGANASGINATVFGQNAKADGIAVTAIGQDATTDGINATAIGQNAKANSINTTAIGQGANANSINTTAIGQGANANSINTTAIGQGASANSINATAIGVGASSGFSGLAGGQGANASMSSVALGAQSAASAMGSVAIGNNSSATVNSGIALGQDSVASIEGGAIGFVPTATSVTDKAAIAATNSTNLGAVSVGTGESGGNRQIVNVAAGTNDSDAVNVAQLTSVANIANQGFNMSADNGATDNVQLGEVVNFTNTDGNLVATVSDNGINYDLAQNIDLGADGSLKTGNTVTNNAGVRIDDGNGNSTAVTTAGTNVTDENGNTGNYGARSTVLTDALGNTNASAAIGNAIFDDQGNTNLSGAIGNAVFDNQGNANLSGARGNIILDDAGNRTITAATGTNVTDGTNTSDYGANGFTITDGTDTTTLNQTGLSFTDANGSTGPSITKAGIDANSTVITNVGDAVNAGDAVNKGQLDNLSAGAVQYEHDVNGVDYNQVTLAGTPAVIETVNGNSVVTSGGTTLSNVANGVNAADAVNKGQLDSTTSALTNAGLQFSGDNTKAFTRKLGEELKIRGGATEADLTDNNIGIVSNDTDTLTVKLNKDIDLGDTGSVTTGNTVTNTDGVAITDGTVGGASTTMTKAGTNVVDGQGNEADYTAAGSSLTDIDGKTNNSTAFGNIITNGDDVTTLTATGTNVTDGINTSNYGAEGFIAMDGFGNTGSYNADSTVLNDNSGNTNESSAMGNALLDSSGNVNLSGARGNAIFDDIGNLTTTSAQGLIAMDTNGNSTIVNQTGLSFTDTNGSTGPSITKTGIDAGDTVITNVADGSVVANSQDAVNGGQLFNTAESVKNVIGGNAINTGGVITTTNIGGTGATTIDGAITSVKDAATKAKTTVTEGKNITVTASTNQDGSTDYNVKTKDALDLTSVTTGNTVTNTDGVTITDGANITAVTKAGTNVTDGTNTSDYGANGFTVTDGTDTTTINQTGLSFTDANGATGPSITAAGIDAGDTVITNVGDAVNAGDAVNKGQLDNLSAGAVQYARNPDNSVNYDQVTLAGTPAVIKTVDGNSVVTSGGTTLSNVANGVNADDAVNKGQLDSMISQNVTDVEITDQTGNPVTVNVTDQVVNRKTDNDNMDSLFLTYNVEGQDVTDRLTIGETVQKMNTEGVKFAHTNAANAKGNLGVTNDSSAGGENSTAIGVNAIIAEGADSTVALGHNTDASANATNSVVIGNDSQVAGQSSIAIGDGAQAMGSQSISVGTGNIVNGNNSGAFGDPSIINGNNSYSVGNNNTIDSDDTFVFGNNVTSTVEGSVVLGTGSAATTGAGVAGYLSAGNAAITATTSTTGAVAVGDTANGVYRQVTGVAAGTADSDAVNVSQLKAVSDALQGSNDALSNAAVKYDENADGSVNKGSITLGGGAAGTTITNVSGGAINASSTEAINGSQLYNLGNDVAGVIGGNAAVDNDGNLTVSNIGGTGADNLNDAIAAVNNGNAQANAGIQANVDRLNTGLSFSADSGANVDKSIGDSTALTFEGSDNITTTTTDSGIKFDLNGNISVDNITAATVTTGNTTVNTDGVTIKDGPSVTAAGIDAGDKVITGVADGLEVTDAVNFGQLSALDSKLSNSVNELGYKINEVEDDANAGISAAMAMSSLPQAYIPGKSMVGGGIATYNGQSAVAVGVSKVSDNGRWVIKVNGTADTQGNAGGAVGAGFHF